MDVSLSVNQTTGEVIYDYLMKGNAGYYGSSSAGCVTTRMYWEQYFTSIPKWSTIKTLNDSNELDCKGVTCSQGSPSFFVWYSRTIRCDVESNVSIRMHLVYTRFGSRRHAYSPTKTQECTIPYVPPITEEVSLWLGMFLFMFAGLSGLDLWFKKKKKKKNFVR